MDAILLVGGLGTRLRSVIGETPKALAPVAGRPFVEYLFGQLAGFRVVRRVVMAVGHCAELVVTRYGRTRPHGLEVGFSVEARPLGTGGAIRQAIEMTRGPRVLALNGDSYAEFDIDRLEDDHVRRGAALTLVLARVDDARRYGQVVADPATMQVRSFAEKAGDAREAVVNGGVYMIERDAILRFPAGTPLSMETEVLPRLVERGLYGHMCQGRFIDIGTPEAYARAQSYFAGWQPPPSAPRPS